jgi:hypothetical protein
MVTIRVTYWKETEMLPATVTVRNFHGLDFAGPIFRIHQIPRDPGVLLVMRVGGAGQWSLLEVLFTPSMRDSVEGSPRRLYWADKAQGHLGFAFARADFPAPALLPVLAQIAAEREPDTWHDHPSYAPDLEGSPLGGSVDQVAF